MLIKSLPKIAARILKNTWGIPQAYKQKLELVQEAYGSAAVDSDFEWCIEVKDNNPRYPVTEYLKVIDSRLGSAPKEEAPDPRVAEISALTYKLTRRPAPPKQVRDLLAQFAIEEIIAALTEYIEGIEERELAYAPRMFFVDGGCAAIITARKQRDQDRLKQIQRDVAEKNMLDGLINQEHKKSEEQDRQREIRDAEPRPSAEDLFGTTEPQ
jgi:hypothetical protein